MFIDVITQVTTLAQSGEVLRTAVHLIPLVAWTAVRQVNAQVSNRQNNPTPCDRVREMILSAAPFTAIPRADISNVYADLFPVAGIEVTLHHALQYRYWIIPLLRMVAVSVIAPSFTRWVIRLTI